jgi:ATP-binding cassette subfamily C protein LapB
MAGLVEPTSGFAQIDNIDLTQIQPDDLRNHVSVMLQSPAIFSGTLKENLLFGKPDATDEEIFEISKITGVDLLASELQGGFTSVLNEGGQMISGGQRQAICLTRALINKSKILLLDEPTSSMDTQTEGIFINNFKSWIGEATVIIATHKGRVLDAVDRVVVLENGRVVADGKKEDILRSPKPKVEAVK